MKYYVNMVLSCPIILNNEKESIGDIDLSLAPLGFQPDNYQPDNRINYIGSYFNATTKEDALHQATKKFEKFSTNLSYTLNQPVQLDINSSTIQEYADDGKISINTNVLFMGTTIANDIKLNEIKTKLIQYISKKHPLTPLRFYNEGLQSKSTFEKFTKFYKILEFYHKNDTDEWIKKNIPKIKTHISTIKNRAKNGSHRKKITELTYIRHKLSHGSRGKYLRTPLLESNPKDVKLVEDNLEIIKGLAKKTMDSHNRK